MCCLCLPISIVYPAPDANERANVSGRAGDYLGIPVDYLLMSIEERGYEEIIICQFWKSFKSGAAGAVQCVNPARINAEFNEASALGTADV